MRVLVDQGIVKSFQLGFAKGNRIAVEVEASAAFDRVMLHVEVLRAMSRAMRVADLSRRVFDMPDGKAPDAASGPDESFIEELRSLMQADEDDEAVYGWMVEEQQGSVPVAGP